MGLGSLMGFDDAKSGHTAALDLEELEKGLAKKGLSEWEDKRPEKSAWASEDWDGNKVDWPEGFGRGGGPPGGGTAVLDLDELGLDPPKEEAVFSRPQSARAAMDRGALPNQPSSRGKQSDDNWPAAGFGGGGAFDGGGFGGGSENTMALDLNAMEELPSAGTSRGDEARYEDGRTERKKGSKKGAFDMSTYGGADDEAPSPAPPPRAQSGPRPLPRRPGPAPIPAAPPPADSELGPNERTMALDLDTMRKGAAGAAAIQPPAPSPPAQELPANARTMAMSVEDLRKGSANLPPGPASGLRPLPGGAQQAPEGLSAAEKTMAMDIPSGPGGGLDLDAMRRAAAGAGGGDAGTNDSTTVLDESMFDQAKAMLAQSSNARLLVFAEGAQQPVTFPLRPGLTNIGRDRSNHLVLADQFASRKHLRIKKTASGFEMRDNGSDNITLVNNAESTFHNLQHGDEITVGSTVLRFIVGEPTPQDLAWPAPPPPPQGMAPAPAAPPTQAASGLPGGLSLPALLVLGFLVFGSLALVVVLVVMFAF